MSVHPASERPASARTSAAIGAAFLAFYALTSATVAPALIDGYSELVHGLAGTGARPNHLLLSPLWRGLAALFGPPGDAQALFRAAVASNAVAGAIALGIWHFVARRHGVRSFTALVGVLVLGFGSAWWSHARDVESAMIAHVFFLAAFLPAVAGSRSGARALAAIAAGGAFALSVLFALNLVVFAPAWLLALRDRAGARTPLLAGAAALLAVPLFLFAHAGTAGAPPFFRWLLSHPTAHLMGAVRPGLSVEGAARAFAGAGRFFVTMDGGVPAAVKRLIVGEPALRVSAGAALEFALAAVLLAACATFILRRLRRRDPFDALDQGALATLGLAAIVNVAWLGSDPQFWLPVFPVVAWMALRGATAPAGAQGPPRRAGFRRVLGAVLAGTLLAANLRWATPTVSAPAGSPAWRSAREFAAARERPTLLFGIETPWSFFVAYGHPRIARHSWLYGLDGTGRRGEGSLFAEADSALRAGGEVFVEDLVGPDDLRGQGTWENVENAAGLTRSDLARAFASRYSLVDLPLPGGATGSLQQARLRAPVAPPEDSGTTPPRKED